MVSSEGACAAYYRYRRMQECNTGEPAARAKGEPSLEAGSPLARAAGSTATGFP